ncbi:hypothetical protein FNV43_RR04821 [Rhamnella rubrinervis]|uniref:Nucleolar protein 58 n=1 Tax=Rhamnella rubrinervis TaxID=2594499 RepID=A0A8K0HLJ1_9ROSA|nr:hypothetical protein FNV43_RR04821 [Rhamnella rubrinervis]
MRIQEWYGWHFPELANIVQDDILYAKTVKLMGNRTNAAKLDFSEILPEDVEAELKEAAIISVGSDESKMNTIAPNLTALVGELVGARLIARGGGLLNLAKQPGCRIQILGAKRGRFRGSHATPKHGLIYHAPLIEQTAPKLKGKLSRSLAAKMALSIRCDAFGDHNQDNSMGLQNRAKLEARLRNLEDSGSAKKKPKIEQTDNAAPDSKLGQTANTSADHQVATVATNTSRLLRSTQENIHVCFLGLCLTAAFGVFGEQEKMLLLFETPAGFALFKVLDEGKLSKVEDLWKDFSTSESARQVESFFKFENTSEALEAATLLIESKPSKGLRKFLRAHCDGESLAVGDSKLGNIIKEKLKIECIHSNAVMELMRGVRNQLTELIAGLAVQDLAPMSLGLSHSLSRYKLKFSADKVDTMIIQAIGLLDDLDKELNTYAMRVREWYGWHFPELAKIVQDNILYAKAVKLMGNRTSAAKLDFTEILPEEIETELKEAAMISMGIEVSDLDLTNIKELCDQVLSLQEYRAQLYDYLKNRNLTVLVGGARLIAHGGSLLNLAKQPGSTIQILGAEKALFRALKTKHATPKYGLIYHASLIGQAAQKLKGKISRSLATKSALAIRCDALGDNQDTSMGLENRAKLEARLRSIEGRELGHLAGSAKGKPKIEVYDKDRKKGDGALITAAKTYNAAADSILGQTTSTSAKHQEATVPKKKNIETAEEAPSTGEDRKEKKKKKKKNADDEDTVLADGNASAQAEDGELVKKKKRKKHSAKDVEVQNGFEDVEPAEKKKKKRKRAEEEESEIPIKREKRKKKKSED